MLGINVLATGEPIFYKPAEAVERSEEEVDHVEETREDVVDDSSRVTVADTSGRADVADSGVNALAIELTAYTAYCNTGCTGQTATGLDVSSTIYHEGKRIVAVDPDVIPLGSTVAFTLADGTVIDAVAADTGGAIRGNRMDLLVGTKDRAWDIGRQTVEVNVR